VDRTSIFLALTIGIPFCTFKLLFGILAWRNGLTVGAILLGTWAALDLVMNIIRIVLAVGRIPPRTEFCILAQLGRRIGLSKVLLAVDTLFAFGIICLVLWSGWIAQLGKLESAVWLTATSVNLLSVALTQIWCEISRRREKASESVSASQ